MKSYHEKLERQLQALKGLLMTLPTLRDAYARSFSARGDLGMPAAMSQMQCAMAAHMQISDVLAHIGHFSSCLSISVVSHSVVRAFECQPHSDSQGLEDALAPLKHIVKTKVWSPKERHDLFKRCFDILRAANGTFAHLMQEVIEAFPEETRELIAKDEQR